MGEDTPDKETAIKLGINKLLWMYGDGKMTLDEAEKRAVAAFRIIVHGI